MGGLGFKFVSNIAFFGMAPSILVVLDWVVSGWARLACGWLVVPCGWGAGLVGGFLFQISSFN